MPAVVPSARRGDLEVHLIKETLLHGGSNVKPPFIRMCLQAVLSVQTFLKLVFLCLETSAYLIASICLHPLLSAVISLSANALSGSPFTLCKLWGSPTSMQNHPPLPGTPWGKVPWRPIGLNLYKVKYGKYAVGSRNDSK